MNHNQNMEEYMEFGSLVPLKDGWFLDTETNTKFQLDENGNPIDELGMPVFEDIFNDEEYPFDV
jgi:hypothetical protein